MVLEKYHARMAAFSANAEALANMSLRQPVLQGDDVRFSERTGAFWGGVAAQTNLGGKIFSGFAKTGNRREATTELYMGLTATLLGAPSTPYLLLENCAASDNERRPHQIDTIRLFSVPAFDDYTIVRAPDFKGGDPVSLGALVQHRIFISSRDGYALNIARGAQGPFASLDHEDSFPQNGAVDAFARKNDLPPDRNRSLLAEAWKGLESEAERQAFIAGADEMAARIYQSPDALLDDPAALMATHGWEVQPEIVDGLKARRNLFRRGAKLPRNARL